MRSDRVGPRAGSAPVVVEFVGVPGSGKTTTADHLVEQLVLAGIDAGTIVGLARRRAAATTLGKLIRTVAPRRLGAPLLWWVFYALGIVRGVGFLLGNPGLARAVVGSQARRRGPVRTRWHIVYWFLQLVGRYRLLLDGSTGVDVLVIDDGFVHRSVHLYATSLVDPHTRSLDRYLDLIPVPDLVVRVDTDTRLCLERVIDRGVWAHSRHLTRVELGSYLAAARAVVDSATEAARRRGTTVVEVPGTGDSAEIAGEICRQVLLELPPQDAIPADQRARPVLRLPRRGRITNAFAARLHEPIIDAETLDGILEELHLPRVDSGHNIWLSRRNRNMVVETGKGRKVVKLYRPQWTPATVECAHSILRRLEEVESPGPRLVRSPSGADQVPTKHGVAAVFDFVDGANLSMYYLLRPDRLRLTREAGRTLAELHLALEDFTPSGQHHLGFAGPDGPRRRDLRWFGETLQELTDRSGQLNAGDAAVRAASLVDRSDEVYSSLEQLDRKVSDASFPRLVIHGDYGLHNLLFRPGLPTVPVDFELSRLDWRIFDLISALGKHRFKDGSYDFESMDAFLSGYTSRSPLSEQEVALFPDAWRFYKLQAVVQYWFSYFMTDGPVRKLDSALDALAQSDWVTGNETDLAALVSVEAGR